MIRLPVTVSRGLKLIFSPQNIKIKMIFLIDNEDLTQLRHLDWPADSNASLGGPVDQLSLKNH